MSLSDLECRRAVPGEKGYRIFDSGGLYLDVKPTGNKVWRFKYQLYGKEKLLTIGRYPVVSLLKARERRDFAKQAIIDGLDPAKQKQDQKRLARFKNAQTFETVAKEWHSRYEDSWSTNHGKHILSRLKANVFPIIGQVPVSEVTVQDLLTCLQKVEDRGRNELARRILQIMGQVIRYAVITGRAERDITVDLKGALKRFKKGHYAAIEIDQLPELLKALEKNEARLFKQTVLAIKLILLTFVRTGELINATWNEIDLEKEVWNIPAERMKTRLPHMVPLSRQVIGLLNELGELYGKEGFILPSTIRSDKPISNNTILGGLARLGYKKKMTGHGFRSLAMSTIKEKLNYRHEVVDRQLAHQPRNKIDKAYDRAKFIPERVRMMQDWADYIDRI